MCGPHGVATVRSIKARNSTSIGFRCCCCDSRGAAAAIKQSSSLLSSCGRTAMVRGSDPDAREVRRVNEQLEERHFEFRSNCNDGDGMHGASCGNTLGRRGRRRLTIIGRHRRCERVPQLGRVARRRGQELHGRRCATSLADPAELSCRPPHPRCALRVCSRHVPPQLREERVPSLVLQPRASLACVPPQLKSLCCPCLSLLVCSIRSRKQGRRAE
jgi:hypothetical protein